MQNFSNWFNFYFLLSCIHYHNLEQWQIKWKPVQKTLNHNICVPFLKKKKTKKRIRYLFVEQVIIIIIINLMDCAQKALLEQNVDELEIVFMEVAKNPSHCQTK